MSELIIRRATAEDLDTVWNLLARSARWMHEGGWDAWPPGGFPAERITPGIERGHVWLLLRARPPLMTPIATLTLDSDPDPEFQAPETRATPIPQMLPDSRILHRMAVDRASAAAQGYGALLLEWAADRAHREGARHVLANVARRAVPLQRWYHSNGFVHLATVTSTRTPQGLPRKSGSLWGRPAAPADLRQRLTEQE